MQTQTSAYRFMPTKENELIILKERAKLLAEIIINKDTKTELVSYIKFRLGKSELYGIEYTVAKEVLHHCSYVSVPFAPTYIAGIFNWRGKMVSVIDLKKYLNIQQSDYGDDPYIIVVKAKQLVLGVLVNRIEGSDFYDAKLLDKPIVSDSAIKSEYLMGLNKGLVGILNVDRIFSDITSQLNP